MTAEQVEILNLGITPIDGRTIIVVESGLEWVKAHTTLDFNMNNTEDLKALPSCVRLFLIQFFEVQMLKAGVSSESIEDLSQSFDTSDKNSLIWQYADELLEPYLKSRVRFVPATRKWK